MIFTKFQNYNSLAKQHWTLILFYVPKWNTLVNVAFKFQVEMCNWKPQVPIKAHSFCNSKRRRSPLRLIWRGKDLASGQRGKSVLEWGADRITANCSIIPPYKAYLRSLNKQQSRTSRLGSEYTFLFASYFGLAANRHDCACERFFTFHKSSQKKIINHWIAFSF